MLEELKNKVLVVTFEKKDGSIRRMVCTQKEDYLPKISGESKGYEGITTVWDVEKEGWRSFKTDSVIGVEEYTPESN